MRKLELLTAEKLLNIDAPELLFSYSEAEAKREYRLLAYRWHPDREHSTHAQQVFAHIADLYKSAKEKIKSGDWCEPADKIEYRQTGWHRFRLTDGSVISCKYRTKDTFELGEMYVCDNTVAYELRAAHANLFENGRKRIHLLNYKDDSMLLEMTKYLPLIKSVYKTSSTQILLLHKTPDQLRLVDVLNFSQGIIEPVAAVGWILNGLLNIACYLEWSGLTHNSISPENVYISPLRHSVMLLGGWWYATKCGEELKLVPESTYDNLPQDVIRTKRADSRIDVECIKAVGRKMVGLQKNTPDSAPASVPAALLHWLSLPATGPARNEYKNFKEVLLESFGPPKFVHMKLDADLLYKE